MLNADQIAIIERDAMRTAIEDTITDLENMVSDGYGRPLSDPEHPWHDIWTRLNAALGEGEPSLDPRPDYAPIYRSLYQAKSAAYNELAKLIEEFL